MRTKDNELLEQILYLINDYFKENDCTPTLQEIADKLGIAKATAYRYVQHLKETGKIDITDRFKGIRTKTISKVLDSRNTYPILGTISCGTPLFAEENIEGYFSFPSSLLGAGEFFCLWAIGNSMINAGIKEGDLVICRKQNTANEGQIVVALCDNTDATLKRYYLDKKNKRFRLHPENDEMEDMFYKNVQIQGIAVKVVSNLE